MCCENGNWMLEILESNSTKSLLKKMAQDLCCCVI